MTHTRKIAMTGIQCACLYSRRPTNAVIRNPAIGSTIRAGISDSRLISSSPARRRTSRAQGAGEQASEGSQSYVSEPAEQATQRSAVPQRADMTAADRSLAHRVVFVHERRLLVAVDRDQGPPADARLTRRDGHDHER